MVSLQGHAGDRIRSISGILKVGVLLKTMFSKIRHLTKYSHKVQLLCDSLQYKAIKKVPQGGEQLIYKKLLGLFNRLQCKEYIVALKNIKPSQELIVSSWEWQMVDPRNRPGSWEHQLSSQEHWLPSQEYQSSAPRDNPLFPTRSLVSSFRRTHCDFWGYLFLGVYKGPRSSKWV